MRGWARFLTAGPIGVALALSAALACAQSLPAMKFVTASLVSPSAAATHFGTATTHTNSLSGVAGFGATAPEIVETARALKNNPDTIFDFVHNQIQTEYAFGERKGPIGALIDKSGTPFDQNVLFVNLVRQAGYSARYQIGQATMTSAAFTAWTGVSDIGAACRMLSSGGIPAAFSPSAPANCQTSGAFTSVTLLHIWSQVRISGTWYAYDPGFKTYAGPAPANLTTASGLTPGAAASAAATGVTSGVQGGANYIRGDVQADGQVQLAAYLTARGTQLLTWLKANAPALDTDQVTGVTKIQQAYAPVGGWRNATPPGYTTGSAITISGDIPDQYRTKFQVAMTVAADGADYVPALNWPFYVDDIDGRRIGITTNFNNTGGVNGGNINPAANPGFVPLNYTIGSDSLVVDDVVVQTWSCTVDYNSCRGAMSPGQVTLTATHPYAAGAFADETVVKQLTATGAPVAIVSGWGMVSSARLARWSDEVADDSALPAWNTAPWPCVGGDVCFPTYAQSSGDLTRQKLAASWLAQISRMMTLQAVIGGAVAEHQHSMGVVDWRHTVRSYQYPAPNQDGNGGGPEYLGIADEFSDLNIDTVASVTSKTNSAPSVAAISRSVALASATLEGSVLEQMEDLPDSASTASRFAWGNNPGADNQAGDLEDPCFTTNNPRSFFDFTGTNSSARAGLYTFEGSTTGCGAIPLNWNSYPQPITAAAESAIASYLTAGFHVTGSAEVLLGPGARFGPCAGLASKDGVTCMPTQQRGDALIATLFDGSGNVLQVAHVLTGINGISKGGGGKQPEHIAAYDPSKAGDALKDRFVDRSVALGVDLKSGTAGYATPTLLSTGTGSAPYKLDYSLSYKAAPTGCNAFGPCTGAIQGGWNSNWDVRFSNAGSGLEAMGATSPFAAAGTLTAFLAMQDIYSQAGTSTLQPDVYAAMAADWWRQQMLANVGTLNRGFTGAQYLRLADGSWLPPVGSPGVLTQTGTRVKVRDTCFSQGASYGVSTSRRWDLTGVNFSLRDAGGDVMAFAPWSWEYDKADSDNCAIAQGYAPTTWTWPQGVSLTFTYGVPDPNGYSQTDTTGGVSAIASSLGRSITLTGGFSGNSDGVTPKALTATTAGPSGSITVGQTSAANPATIADATGAAWKFSYTDLQQRTASQRPVPYTQLYQVFEPVSTTLPALQYGYDTRGLVETAYDANGLQLAANAPLPPYRWYLALGGQGERDDPLGGAYRVYYDTDGNEVRNIDEIGREVDSTWDGRHRVLSRTFPEGDQEAFGYDANDNVLQLTKVAKPGSSLANIVVQATYETSWNHLASITDPMGKVTNFTYYPSAGLCGTTGVAPSLMCLARRPAVAGSRPTYSYQYNAIGLPTQSVDPTGVTTAHGYDSYGNLTSTTEGAAAVGSNPALNLTTTFTPDAWGDVTATTDPLTHTSNQTFDLDRRVVLAIAPDPGTGIRPATKTSYDANGRPYQVDKGTTDASGATFTAAETTTTAFDPNGNKIMVSVLNGTVGASPLSVTQMNHDSLNRVICTAERENPAAFSSLPDACAQSAPGVYGADPITKIAYDLAGQELSETRGLGTSLAGAYTTFTWGADGEKASVADANGNLINLGYDGFNRLNLITHPDGTTEASQYDPDGDLVIWTNRGGFGVVRCYDVLNRKISETGITGASLSGACATGGTTNLNTRSWDIQPRTFAYDLAGRLTGANIPNYPLSYAYDAAGRPTGRGASWTAGYGWDNAGNLNALTYPDGTTVVNYQYDALNRTTKALIGTKSYGALSYDALGRRQTLTFPDGSSQTWGYDNADRVTSIAHVFPNDTGNNVTFTYGYDPVGREVSKTVDNAAFDYVPPAANVTYAAANALNQYPSVGGYAYSYWPEGGLKQTDTVQANYNELGKAALTYITATPGTVDPNNFDIQGADALDHVYFHYRQTTAGSTYPFIYHSTDGLRPETIWEWVCNQTAPNAPVCTGSGLGPRYYVLGPDPDERWAFTGVSGAIYAPHTDREGTLIALANGGQVAHIYTWDAYGQNTAPASDTGPGATGYLYRYTGQRLDPNTGLYDYKARDYSPTLGRFYQPDPAGLDQGPNLYEYVGGNPVGTGDPSGECPVVACGVSQDDTFGAWAQANDTTLGNVDDQRAAADAVTGGVAPSLMVSMLTPAEGGSGHSANPPDLPPALQKANLADPKQNGKAEAEKEEAIGMAAVPAIGMALGAAVAAAPEAIAAIVAKSCFTAGTLVQTDHGLRPIEQIKNGDLVLSRDDRTGVTAYKRVLSLIRPLHRRIFTLTVEVGQGADRHRAEYDVTDHHPWRSAAGQWTPTLRLTPRDQIIRAQGPPARVIAVRRTSRFENTYNLEVADFHTYFVGSDRLWVHNACRDLVSAARELGYKLDRGFGRMHGQDVFRNGSRYITRDVDSHSGGVWKMFDRQGNRLGTFDKDLNRIGD